MQKQPIKSHEDLEVYQMAFNAAMIIFELSKQFPVEERYSLTDRRGRGAGSGGQGERFWNSPATGFQAPGFSYEKEKNKYFETRSARNTASKLQAPPFMDGVSPCSLPPAPCLFLTKFVGLHVLSVLT